MSSRKNTLKVFKMIDAGDMSGNLTSIPTNVEFLDNIALQLNFTGTPTGTFAVEVSIDYDQDSLGNILNAGNWIPLTLSPAPAATGSGASIFIELNQTPARWLRVTYTATSGVGSLDALISAKML